MNLETAKNRVLELSAQIEEHNYNYYQLDNPTISDREFDKLLEELTKLEEKFPDLKSPSSPTQRVGGTITKNFNVVKHQKPMISLANSYSEQDVTDFHNRLAKLVDTQFAYYCQLKLDGASLSLTYENGELKHGVTRGDGAQGDEITANVKTIKSIPLKIKGDCPAKFEVRGEVMLHRADFDVLNKQREENGEAPMMNPRNAASGALKLQNSAETAKRKLDFFAYYLDCDGQPLTDAESIELLKKWGFKISEHNQVCNNLPEVFEYIESWREKRHNLGFDIDGIVLKMNEIKLREIAGSTSKVPRWAIAYKYESEQAETTLLSVEFHVGRIGTITPVANLDVVLLSGTNVKRASIYNADEVERLDLYLGDHVLVEKGGEIIPKIVGVLKEKRKKDAQKVVFPTECPECNSPISRKPGEANYYCTNHENCKPQIKGIIEHYADRKAMAIEGLGEEIVSQLVEQKAIANYSDLYDLTVEQLLKLERFAKKSATNLIKSIEKSKEMPFEKVLFALGIRHVGANSAIKLAKHFGNIDKIMAADIAELSQTPEVGSTVAQSIKDFFDSPVHKAQIEKLKKAGLKFTLDEASLPQVKSDKLAGKTFIFSGVFEGHNREDLKTKVEENGGKILSSISKNLNYLVAGADMGPSKLEKATALKTPIITVDEFLKMLE